MDPTDPALLATAAAAPALDETLASGPSVPGTARGSAAPRGRRLGRFTIEDTLGAGAMGIVYRAEDPELGRRVALKLLHRPDSDLTQRLVREARAMAQVNHPNVVTIYDVGEAEGSTYIAMELVVGTSLRAWQAKPRARADIVAHYLAAGRGLAAAHASGLIHRDFKPDNVLVGADGRVRVSDFGLAASHGDPAAASGRRDGAEVPTELALTATGTFLGTPAYMAPEQFEHGNIDSRTDQFAFCVALHEALYGTRPFAGKTFQELADAVGAGRVPPAPPRTTVSSSLRRIVLRGLSVRPGDRFPSMDHLLAELGRDRARPWRRRALGAGAVAVALALGLVADLAAQARLAHETREAFRRTGKQTQLAMDLFAEGFRAFSDAAYVAPWLRDVSATHKDADFGLGSTTDDADASAAIHEMLSSVDMRSWTQFSREDRLEVVCDRSGAVVYASADPKLDRGDLSAIAAVHALIAGSKNATQMQVLPNDHPALASTHVLGTADPHGVSFLFGRSIAPATEVGAIYLQFADGQVLLKHISTDPALQLALVTPEGRYTPASAPPPLAAVTATGVAQIEIGDVPYQVQAVPLFDHPDGPPIARVVMARRMDSLLTGLFPHARVVFAAALAAALALAGATAMRARSLAG